MLTTFNTNPFQICSGHDLDKLMTPMQESLHEVGGGNPGKAGLPTVYSAMRELTKILVVSVSTMRQCSRRLAILGVIEVRSGGVGEDVGYVDAVLGKRLEYANSRRYQEKLSARA